MLELAHPLWLLGLALVPAVRWLHRLRAPGQPQRVPALFLWREAATTMAPGKRRGPPDPAWRHRALLLALGVLALAGPAWNLPVTSTVEVWLDDGPALFAREPGVGDRLGEAARSLAAAAVETDTARLRVKALRRPAESVDLVTVDPLAIEDRLRAWLVGPGPGPLSAPAAGGTDPRWLVSTGSDPRALDALAGTPFARVIPVGLATHNQALVGLSLRPSLTSPDRLVGLVEVWGSGPDETVRTLVLRLDGKTLDEVALSVPGDGSVSHAFAVAPLAPGRLEARLEPAAADSLPLDDGLSLALGQASPRAAVAVEGACDPSIATFLSAHPGLRPVAAGAELLVRCDGTPPPRGEIPTLWLVQGEAGEALREPPAWHVESRAVAPHLAPEWLRPVSPPVPLAGQVLLGAGPEPLILEQDDPRRIVLLLDTAALRDRPELPVLLGLLLDRLAGRELLMPVARIGRDPAEVRVAPGPLPAARPAEDLPADRQQAAPWLIVGALGLALHDLGRRARAALAT